jgi:hypothetical protein
MDATRPQEEEGHALSGERSLQVRGCFAGGEGWWACLFQIPEERVQQTAIPGRLHRLCLLPAKGW